MQTDTWLCRAGLLGAMAITFWTITLAGADEPAPTTVQTVPRINSDSPPVPGRSGGIRGDLIDDTGLLPKYRLDMTLASVPKALDEQLQLGGEGALVTHVGENGPAHEAGLKVHDIVLAVGEAPIKRLSDVGDEVEKFEGKEISLKILRAGKPLTLAITPQERFKDRDRDAPPTPWLSVPALGELDIDIQNLEAKIREKLKDAGIDLRLQLIEPGRFVPRVEVLKVEDFPDDLSIHVRKTGKEPAQIEVKQGDKSWTVTEDKLDELPEEVREHVKTLLGRAPMRFAIKLPGGQNFEAPLPPGFEPAIPERAQAATEAARQRASEMREQIRQRIERRLDDMSREMEQMRQRMEELRQSLRQSDDGDEKREGDQDKN